MKKNVFSIIITVFLIFLISGCSKAPINGDLDGQWEVVEVSPTPQFTIISGRLYYNFSLHTCMLSFYGGTFLFANMDYHGNQLSLDFAEESTERQRQALAQYGIIYNPITFQVDFKDSHHLTLTNNEVRIELIKH